MKKQLLLLLVPFLSTLLIAVNTVFAQTWVQTSAPTNMWDSIASSADGTKLIAVAHSTYVGRGGIFVSTNSGTTWTLTCSHANNNWISVASAADGSKLVALALSEGIYVSTNSGTDWIQATNPNVYWGGVAGSADGAKWIAVGGYLSGPRNSIYISTDSGTTWALNSLSTVGCNDVASSADGTKLAIAGVTGIYTSTNSGDSWTQAVATGDFLNSIISSTDGSKLVATGTAILISDDGGVSWTQYTNPITTGDGYDANWNAASSADASKLIIARLSSIRSPVPIYTSADFGFTWKSNSAPKVSYCAVASSADGTKLVVAAYGGGIYTYQTTPAPVLNIAPSNSNLAFSWIVPSMYFVLQQNSNLCTTNWTDVTNMPALNLTNLQNQVALPLPAGNAFYRLKTP